MVSNCTHSEYGEDQFLQIAGLQHFSFCRRQWALILYFLDL